MATPPKKTPKSFSLSSISGVVEEIIETPLKLESLVHNENIFSASVASVLLLVYDNFRGTPPSLSIFLGHEMLNLAVGTCSGVTVTNLANNASMQDKIMMTSGSVFAWKMIWELLMSYAGLQTFDVLDLVCLSAITAGGFAVGSYVFETQKMSKHDKATN